MKKAVFALVLLFGLLLSVAGYSTEKAIKSSSSVQSQLSEWVEYVYIGDQLYKITHYDDGSETIQAVFIGSND